MDTTLQKEKLDLGAGALLTGLCVLWGLNAVAIKISNAGIDPVFGAAVRSIIAAAAMAVWMRARGTPLFGGRLLDGIAVGILFGVEFCFLFTSLLYTTASSAWILLYTTPFFHALGAHFLLRGDRLNLNKGMGLLLAFAGVLILLSKHLGLPSREQLLGDVLALWAAVFWAATTIYIKRRLVGRVSHHHTLFYQTVFSVPVLFLLSVLLKEAPVTQISAAVVFSMAFQGLVIAFFSYLLWFFMVHTYPVTRLSAFTFLTPVFATLAGALFLGEPFTPTLVIALTFVSLGIYIVNRDAP